MNPQSHTPFNYVDTDDGLRALVARMKPVERIALDTEADSLHHYFEKVCLLQLTLDDEHYIVDPLCGLDLSSFMRTLARKPLILHSAEYDLRMMRASFGFRPRSEVFDTMQAAQLLGYEPFNLGALVERFFDAVLGRHGQKSDWSRRPLTNAQLQYAVDDTRYLARLADRLEGELAELGRGDWHRETCQRVIRVTARENQRDPGNAWRLKGIRDLGRQELAFVHEIWHWREDEAMKVDRPPFKIMGNQLILTLAVWAASHTNRSLTSGPKLPRDCNGRRRKDLEAAIRKVRDMPETDWPRHRRGTGTRPEPIPKIDELRAECARIAEDLRIDPAVLAPRAALEAIGRKQPADVQGIMATGSLMRWQAELLEPGIRRILDA